MAIARPVAIAAGRCASAIRSVDASRPRSDFFGARGDARHANGRSVPVFTLRAAVALTPLCLLAAPALGQNSQRPVIITPPVGDFSLSPSGPTPTPTPRPTAIPAPVATATPVASPTPRASPRPAATATPRAAPPPTATQAPTPREPAPSPSVSPVEQVTPAVLPTSTGDATPASTPSPDRVGDMPPWLWPALGGGALLLVLSALGGWLIGRRRRRTDADAAVKAVAAAPQPVSPPTPGPPPLQRDPAPSAPVPAPPRAPASRPAAPPLPPPPGSLVTELRPLRATIANGRVTLDFELFVQNRGAESADNVRAVLALLGANADQDGQIGQFHAAARLQAGSEPFSIAPGGVHMLNGQISVPDAQMPAVNMQGRAMFVPVVPVFLRWYAGLSIRTLRDAFMVGTVPAPGGDRLGPLWVDRAASGFGPLAAKRYAPKVAG